jgi:hypothetical protein
MQQTDPLWPTPRQLADARYEKMTQEFKHGAHGKWTSVKEQYPEILLMDVGGQRHWQSIPVIVTRDGSVRGSLFTRNGPDDMLPVFVDDDNQMLSGVTHWMPMPPPPGKD